MLLPFALAFAIGATDPAPRLAADAVLGSDGSVCLATGYCTTQGPGRGGRPPGGLMYLALGLVGSGLTVLRTQRRDRVTSDK